MKFLKFTRIDRFKKRREKDDPGIIKIEYPRYVYRYLVTQIFQQFHDETFETSAIPKISMYNNRETLFNAPHLSSYGRQSLHSRSKNERQQWGGIMPSASKEPKEGLGVDQSDVEEEEEERPKKKPVRRRVNQSPSSPLPSRSMKTEEKGRRKGPVGGTRTRINLEGTRDEKRDEEEEEEEEENGGGAGFECRCRQDK